MKNQSGHLRLVFNAGNFWSFHAIP